MRHWRRWLLLFSVIFFVVMNRESSSHASSPNPTVIASPQPPSAP